MAIKRRSSKPVNIVGSHRKATNEDVEKLLAQGYTKVSFAYG